MVLCATVAIIHQCSYSYLSVAVYSLQMLRKSVEMRDWQTAMEPKQVRAAMKRLVEDLIALNGQVGELYVDDAGASSRAGGSASGSGGGLGGGGGGGGGGGAARAAALGGAPFARRAHTPASTSALSRHVLGADAASSSGSTSKSFAAFAHGCVLHARVLYLFEYSYMSRKAETIMNFNSEFINCTKYATRTLFL